jgi:hypothetical protein
MVPAMEGDILKCHPEETLLTEASLLYLREYPKTIGIYSNIQQLHELGATTTEINAAVSRP